MRKRQGGGGASFVGRWMRVAVLAGGMPTAALAWTIAGNATVQGAMGVGTEAPARQMHVRGDNAVFRMDRDRDGPAFMLVETALGNFNSIYKTFVVSTIASGVNNGSFVINDLGTATSGAGTRRLTIANNGLIGNTETPAAALHIRNPSTGNSLRLDSNTGTPNFYVQNDGDLYAIGADLELRLATATAGGYSLGQTSTLLANTSDGSAEESFLALNSDTATICNPGHQGYLKLMDQDGYSTNYIFHRSSLWISSPYTNWDFYITVANQGDNADLVLSTTGEEIKFIADVDNNTVQIEAFDWYSNGNLAANKLMELISTQGDLRIRGALSQNYAFDLAEAYWKSDAAIEAGDVVCIDPEAPNAVVLARAANDRAVVGVVSTDPGLIMGGGAFSAGHLEDLWGADVAARFAAERKDIEKKLASSHPYLKGRMAQVVRMKSSLAKSAQAADAARAKEAYESEVQQLAASMESEALKIFCQNHLARVALAGRVPVKVDASCGAIQIGDALVASATPGRAMRSGNPASCTVVGKALEPFASGQGTIMMMVLNR